MYEKKSGLFINNCVLLYWFLQSLVSLSADTITNCVVYYNLCDDIYYGKPKDFVHFIVGIVLVSVAVSKGNVIVLCILVANRKQMSVFVVVFVLAKKLDTLVCLVHLLKKAAIDVSMVYPLQNHLKILFSTGSLVGLGSCSFWPIKMIIYQDIGYFGNLKQN